MASRIAPKALRASSSLLRSQAVVPRAAFIQGARCLSDATPQQPPAERANALINALPGNSLLTKTGTLFLGTGAIATAISQELYIVNEETVVLAGFLIIFTYIAKAIREPYKEWAEGHINRIKTLLDDTKTEHAQAVHERIGSVEKMRDVVDVTKGLFALSKETAKLESENFVTRQHVALASELKTVLDSWVRHEQQAKESEQAELVKTVIDKVNKSLADEKTQKDILLSAVAEVEQLVKSKAI